jgi:hypothetical protein
MFTRPCFAHSIAIVALELRHLLVYVSIYGLSRITIDELISFITYHLIYVFCNVLFVSIRHVLHVCNPNAWLHPNRAHIIRFTSNIN